MSDEEPKGADTVRRGDVIRLEFDGWIEETGEMFDTTNEDTARENEIFDENATYGPIPLLVGAGKVFEGLEEAIEGAEVGVEREVILSPEKAAGKRDPKLIELHPVREFRRQDIDPQVGMEVSIKNRRGTITAVTAGRVRVDFNRPLAGNSLRYRLKVVEKIEDPEGKLRAILEMNYGTSEGFEVGIEDGVISIVMPDVCKYDQKWILSKYSVVADLREAFGNVTVRFIEEYPKREEEAPEEAPAPEEFQPEEIPPEESEEAQEQEEEEGSEE